MASTEPEDMERGEEITNELPPKWDPKEGDELAGYYRGHKSIKLSGGTKAFKIYFIEDAETEEVQSFSGAIADRKMARVPRDCFVWVTYTGKVKVGKQGAKANNYKVVLPKGVTPLPEIQDESNSVGA